MGPVLKELLFTVRHVSHVNGVFKGDLGGDTYVTQGDPKSSMVEMYHELNQMATLEF